MSTELCVLSSSWDDAVENRHFSAWQRIYFVNPPSHTHTHDSNGSTAAVRPTNTAEFVCENQENMTVQMSRRVIPGVATGGDKTILQPYYVF